jgi:high-affinity Fe2+/Pb2+ permease
MTDFFVLILFAMLLIAIGFVIGVWWEREKSSDIMIIDSDCFERGCACVDTRVDSKWVTVEMREKL